uniref:Uncharacterized protein n=1 Tax=Moumouvirus sp. 'Monve' TaxID=1128131 RepID=H6WBE5_9VIRU|nr:hypothetical protein tv_R1 [Moumouvirus Monve]
MDIKFLKWKNKYDKVNKLYIENGYSMKDACKKVGISSAKYYDVAKIIREENNKNYADIKEQKIKNDDKIKEYQEKIYEIDKICDYCIKLCNNSEHLINERELLTNKLSEILDTVNENNNFIDENNKFLDEVKSLMKKFNAENNV